MCGVHFFNVRACAHTHTHAHSHSHYFRYKALIMANTPPTSHSHWGWLPYLPPPPPYLHPFYPPHLALPTSIPPCGAVAKEPWWPGCFLIGQAGMEVQERRKEEVEKRRRDGGREKLEGGLPEVRGTKWDPDVLMRWRGETTLHQRVMHGREWKTGGIDG